MLTLETTRLILRDFHPDDFEAFFLTSQDPEYGKFYAESETTREFRKAIFEKILSTVDEEDRLKYQLAICLQTGEMIGTCGVRIEDAEHQQASFGCAIARPYWGKGLAFEASQQIINFGFSSLPVHRIFAETISENTRARLLAERLGMKLEGELRQNRFFRGRWWNTLIYSILRDEWK
jgi:ribosomal-protein-alanine N-acetyltransferase